MIPAAGESFFSAFHRGSEFMGWVEVVTLVVTILFFIVGLAGVFLPVIPGLIIAFAGLLLYAAVDGFEHFSPWVVVLLGVLAVAGSLVDNLAGVYGAKKFGATRWGIWGAVAGLLAGLFFGPLGIIFGPLVGALAGEMLGGREAGEAAVAGVGTLVGFLGGVFVKLLLVLIFIVFFFYKLSCS
jgi:uncharacterized protein YqgC (DUF456 family)